MPVLQKLGNEFLGESLLQMLHLPIIRQDEDGSGVAQVIHQQDPAGQGTAVMHVKHAQAVHHGHLHGGGLIHVEVSFFSVLCIEGLLPLSCRGWGREREESLVRW